MTLRNALLRCLFALTLGWSSGSSFAAEAPRALVIQNVRIFDGVSVIPNGSIVVEGGRVAAVGGSLAVPKGAQLVDGSGKTLLPGLIDAHTHAFGDALKQAIIFGVTTELDMFTSADFAASMRKEQAAGAAADRADLFSASTLVTAPKGHGTQYGMPIPTIEKPEDAPAFVDARIAEGSDYIKIVYDDGKAYGTVIPTVSKATMAAVIQAAHKRGKLAVVHIGSFEGARDAIESGADGLVHLFIDQPADEPLVKLASQRKVFVIPTLTVQQSVAGTAGGASLVEDPILSKALSPTDVASLKRAFPVRSNSTLSYAFGEESIRRLKAAKVPILAGTDAPNPGTVHGAAMHRELELLVKAGLTPVEALAAATSVPADKFKLKDRGRIAPGMRADLLLVDGDPTTDILATRRIDRVWKNGVLVDRGTYIAGIEKTKAAAAGALAVPAPPGSEAGLVSDFEEGQASARFGMAWIVSTDAMAGGKSVGDIQVVEGGANASRGSLKITGQIDPAVAYAWAGAMFYPGEQPMTPTNLSSKKQISFWAKGEGKEYRVMLFATSLGFRPAIEKFAAGADWKRFTFPISAFDGLDGRDLTGIFIGGGPAPGSFALQIDDVRLD